MCEALANLRLLVDLELDVSGNGIGQAIECQLMNLPLSNCFQNMYYSHTYTTHTDTHTVGCSCINALVSVFFFFSSKVTPVLASWLVP